MLLVLAPPRSARPPAASRRPTGPFRWPRQWSEQSALLERQHARIERLLDLLTDRYALPAEGSSAAALRNQAQGCRSLVRLLRLHLRLEERWLAERGALCPGHRAAHGQATVLALDGLESTALLRPARLAWLMDLQEWFTHHRHGPDAIAYARVAQLTAPSTTLSTTLR